MECPLLKRENCATRYFAKNGKSLTAVCLSTNRNDINKKPLELRQMLINETLTKANDLKKTKSKSKSGPECNILR